METILYKQTRTGKIQEWKIWVKDKGNSAYPEVWVSHGIVDGKKQQTYDIIDKGVNIGKANETSPLEQAKLTAERKITKQIEEGYKYTIEEAEVQQSIDFDKRFPKELCFYKPKNSIDQKKIDKLEKASRLIITKKEDGQMYIVRKSKLFGVEIYSRRMDLETEKFPHLVPLFNKLPYGTVLLGEMVLTGYNNHIIAYKNVSKICRSDPEEAIRKQDMLGKTSYRIFDIAFFNYENWLTSKNYEKRYNKAVELAKQCKFESNNYIKAVKKFDVNHTEAMQYAINNKAEGLVLWDSFDTMKDNDWATFNGKAYRPNVVWKSKPKHEDDFIVRFDPDNKIGDYGKGKNKNKLGKVFVYQLDENGREIYLGKCGGGLSDKQREFYTDSTKFPRVWRIEFDTAQPGTGALRYPVFGVDRTLNNDKDMHECLIGEVIKLAREEESEKDE
jgi:hypothetical protein